MTAEERHELGLLVFASLGGALKTLDQGIRMGSSHRTPTSRVSGLQQSRTQMGVEEQDKRDSAKDPVGKWVSPASLSPKNLHPGLLQTGAEP